MSRPNSSSAGRMQRPRSHQNTMLNPTSDEHHSGVQGTPHEYTSRPYEEKRHVREERGLHMERQEGSNRQRGYTQTIYRPPRAVNGINAPSFRFNHEVQTRTNDRFRRTEHDNGATERAPQREGDRPPNRQRRQPENRARPEGTETEASNKRGNRTRLNKAPVKHSKPQSPSQNPTSSSVTKVVSANETLFTSASVNINSPNVGSKPITAKFSSFNISSLTMRSLKEVFAYEYCTVVQEQTLPDILAGKDVLAKAKTGTGKTLAFLIPSIQRLLAPKETNAEASSSSSKGISMLILSPTRELTLQIADEGKKLLTFHTGFTIGTVVGGTNIETDKRMLAQRTPTILVATPGRLIDHLKNTLGCSNLFSHLKIVVLDEADRMLDMGFRPDIERILQHLPHNNIRQTLLFSATVPDGLNNVLRLAFGSNKYEFINTVPPEDDQTHLHVQQEWVIADSFPDQLSRLHDEICREKKAAGPEGYKIIVFFTTARLTQFAAELFCSFNEPVLEIHSRKAQRARMRVAEEFKNGTNKIIFSSDVLARGMDFPNVNLVIQIGLTEKEQYIHRIGRTGRAGKGGRGVIILASYELKTMLNSLSDLPLKARDEVIAKESRECIAKACAVVPRNTELKKSFEGAYQAWLGFYNSNLRKLGWTREYLVIQANLMAKDIGLREVPALQKKTVSKMNLKGVAGIRLQ